MMTKLGKYLIRRELGKGAMGIVYEGFDPVIERTVAIKTFMPSPLTSSAAIVTLARFKREAQAAGRLNHPGIVAIYDYGEAVAEDDFTMVAAPGSRPAQGQQLAFIAMEFVIGLELKDYFDRNERFALHEVERLMCEILEALDHAHGKGVTHRDMKPSNLIMLSDGRIKVADFGIARIETSELTQAGTVMGTPSYMSPEQLMGQAVDGRSDLFSCGVILYQFLTGEKPFTGTISTIMFKVLREDPMPPSALNIMLPAAWDQVTKKAMAKNPDERFQSAREFAMAVHSAAALGQDRLRDADATATSQLRPHATSKPKTGSTPPSPIRFTEPVPTPDTPALAAKQAKGALFWSALMGLLAVMLVLGGFGVPLMLGKAKDDARVPAEAAQSLGPPPAQTSPIIAPRPTAAPTVAQAVPLAVDAVVPAVIPPATAASKPQRAKVKSQAGTAAPPTLVVAPRPTGEGTSARPARCALIIQKAAIDEPISAAERSFLSSSCQ